MSDTQSDIYALLSDLQSDFQSRVPSQVATLSQITAMTVTANVTQWGGAAITTPNEAGVPIVDVELINGEAAAAVTDYATDSNLSALTATVSDLRSDFQSRVPSQVATASAMQAVYSNLQAYLPGMSDTQSDIYALLSDLQSDFQSRVASRVATPSTIDAATSDVKSAITATDSNLNLLRSLVDKVAVICIGKVTNAQTATEVFEYDGMTGTVTVDEYGNRTIVFT
jgi:hypothetical protein